MAVQDMEVDVARGASSHVVGGTEKERAEASARNWRQIEEAAREVNALEDKGEWAAARQAAESFLSAALPLLDVPAYDATQGGPVHELFCQVVPRLIKSLRKENEEAGPAPQEPDPLSFLQAAVSLIPALLPSRAEGTLQALEDLIAGLAWILGDSTLANVMGGSFPMDLFIVELRAAVSEVAAPRCAALVKLSSVLCERGALSQEGALLLVRSGCFEELLAKLSDEQFSKESFPSICVFFQSYETVSRCSPALSRCALRPSPAPAQTQLVVHFQPCAHYPISSRWFPGCSHPQSPQLGAVQRAPSPSPELSGTSLRADRHARAGLCYQITRGRVSSCPPRNRRKSQR